MRELHFRIEVHNCRHFCHWVCDSYKDSKDLGARTQARCVSKSQNLCESSIFESKCTTVVTFVAGFATVTRIPRILEPEPKRGAFRRAKTYARVPFSNRSAQLS